MFIASNVSSNWYDCNQLNYYIVARNEATSKNLSLAGNQYSVVPSFSLDPRSYTIAPSYECAHALVAISPNRSLEQLIVSRAQNINEIAKVYFFEKDMLVSIFVVLNMNQYDYDLMNRIFEDLEFPIKDLFKNKLISFNYLSVDDSLNKKSYEFINLIYNKELNNIKSTFHESFDFYTEQKNNIPEIKIYGVI